MGWRFRKSIKIFPGVKLNFGKKGFTSATIGGKFAKTNISSKGTRNTYTIPKTGLSYQTKLNSRQNYSTNNPPLNRYCSQCGLMNAPANNFCTSCGGVCPPNLQTNNFNGSKIVAPLIIIGSFIGLCAFCGIIGSINKSASNRTSELSNSTAVSLASTRKPLATPIETEKNKSSLNRINGKTADVISENANLRVVGNISSNVVGTIPQGETIGVLKQKGAWFYVATSVGKGWVHGNTIRLNQPDNSTRTQTAAIPVQIPSRPSSTPTIQREESANPTGATARCRDGSLSYSASRRGTCSHHGGVAIWY